VDQNRTEGLCYFPAEAQAIFATALIEAANGGKHEIAKPLSGLGAGVLEIALAYRGNVFGWCTPCNFGTPFG
jgi:phage-related protein